MLVPGMGRDKVGCQIYSTYATKWKSIYFEREKIGSYQTSPKGQLFGRAYVVAVKGTQQTINSTSATAIVSKDDFGFSCLQLSEKLSSHSNAKIR